MDEGSDCCIDFEYTCHPSLTQNGTHLLYKMKKLVGIIREEKSYIFKKVQKNIAGKYTIVTANKGSAEFELEVKGGKHMAGFASPFKGLAWVLHLTTACMQCFNPF